jgi:hypothetical protein
LKSTPFKRRGGGGEGVSEREEGDGQYENLTIEEFVSRLVTM